MLKIIGSIIVILAGGLAGALIARSYEARPRELRELRSALQLLETEIIYGATPLPDAFARVAQSCAGIAGALFHKASQELRAGRGLTAEEAWNRALDHIKGASAIKKDDIATLSGLGSFLGISDSADQGKHMRLVAEQMRHQIEKAENEAHLNVKLWNYLGVSCSVVVVMILL